MHENYTPQSLLLRYSNIITMYYANLNPKIQLESLLKVRPELNTLNIKLPGLGCDKKSTV